MQGDCKALAKVSKLLGDSFGNLFAERKGAPSGAPREAAASERTPRGAPRRSGPLSKGSQRKTAECFCRCEAKLSLSASLLGKGEKGKREWKRGQAAARWRTRDGRSGGRGQNVTWSLSLPDSGRLKSKLRFASRPSKPSAGIRGHQGRVVGGQ